MRQDEIKKLLEVGVLLSAERDINRLLEKILACVMDISHCDTEPLRRERDRTRPAAGPPDAGECMRPGRPGKQDHPY